MAQSYLPVTSQTSGAAAVAAADRKTAKHAPLTQAYSFMAIAAETIGAINSDGIEFLDDLGMESYIQCESKKIPPLGT